MRADLGDDGGAKGDVGHEMAVHDVDVDPVAVVAHQVRAGIAQVGEVCGQDGGRDDGRRGHCGGHDVQQCLYQQELNEVEAEVVIVIIMFGCLDVCGGTGYSAGR